MKHKIICTTPVSHLPGVIDELKKNGTLTLKPNISKSNLKKLLLQKKHNALFVNPNKQGYKIDSSLLDNTSINIINTCSTGLNHIDLGYCKNKKIKVLSLTNDKTLIRDLPSTSELAFGLMLSLLRNIISSYQSVLKYNWNYLPYVGRQVKDLTVGVVGYGRLGKIFCQQLEGFKAKIVVVDPYVKVCKYRKLSLKKALPIVDVLVLHIHATTKNRELINIDMIKLMKKKPIIINTSRGEIVNERDIIRAIKKKEISGYGCDVLNDEFDNIRKSKLIEASKNLPIIITPHIGGMTIEGQTKAFIFAAMKFKLNY